MTNKELQQLLAKLPDDARVFCQEQADKEIKGLWMITKDADYGEEEWLPWKGASDLETVRYITITKKIKNLKDVTYILISEDYQ